MRVRWFCALILFASSTPLVADCPPERMLVVQVKLVASDLPADGPAARPSTLYRVGTKLARLELTPDPERPGHDLIVIREPDIWMVNRLELTGEHLVDPGPFHEFHAPVLEGLESRYWKAFEFGSEVEFMRVVSGDPVAQGESSTFLYTRTYDDVTVRLTTSIDGTPVRVEFEHQGSKRSIEYLKYECREPDLALFETPTGIKFSRP